MISSGGLAEQTGTGTIAVLNGTTTLSVPEAASALFSVSGTWVGTLIVEGSVDDTTWFTWTASDPVTGAQASGYTANGRIWVVTAGLLSVRLRASAWTSGTASIAWNSDGGAVVIPPGTTTVSGEIEVKNDTGNPIPVSDAGGSLTVDGSVSISNFPATQVISDGGGSITVDGTITTTLGTITDTMKAREYTNYSPNPSSYPDIVSEVSMDYSDQIMVRGQVLTDELSLRDDFTGSALTRSLTGNIQWGGNDTHVVGTGSCLFTTQVKAGDYIKKGSDPESAWTQVDYVEDDNSLYLTVGYLGTNGTSTGSVSTWRPVTATGGALTVASSVLTVTSGTTSGQIGGIFKEGDYLPFNIAGSIQLSQRIANQETVFGFRDSYTTPTIQAVFVFDGTTNTSVKCRVSSSSAASDTNEVTVSLPTGNTASYHGYKIDLTATAAVFSIDGTIVANLVTHLPGPYDNLDLVFTIKNTGAAASSTSILMDEVYFSNQDQLEVTNGFQEFFITKDSPYSNTYSATIVGLVAANLATDIFTITGSATKTIKVTKVLVSATQSNVANANILLLRRSTANTGGTSTAPTASLHDTSNASATATVLAYTANPTLGTSAGTIRAIKAWVPTATSGMASIIEWDFGRQRNSQEITLRGTSQVLAVNLNATTLAGNSFNISIEWREE